MPCQRALFALDPVPVHRVLPVHYRAFDETRAHRPCKAAFGSLDRLGESQNHETAANKAQGQTLTIHSNASNSSMDTLESNCNSATSAWSPEHPMASRFRSPFVGG